jgi:class 3 adenylate cyclase
MDSLPTGTVTFAFSDIEGSTGLLKALGDDGYGTLLSVHRRLVRDIFAAHEGREIDTQGDAFFFSFIRARQAVRACVELQRAHARASWPGGASVRVRIGLHTGEPALGDEGYTGLDVVRASRIAAIGSGGQILVSDTTRAIVGADLPEGVRVAPLGERQLKDIDRPEMIFEVFLDDLARVPDASAAQPEAQPETPDNSTDADVAPPSSALGDAIRGARQQIETRVLAHLNESLGGGFPFGPDGPAGTSRVSSPPGGRAMSKEITRLKALRDSGALSDAQYERAVDRLLDGDPG